MGGVVMILHQTVFLVIVHHTILIVGHAQEIGQSLILTSLLLLHVEAKAKAAIGFLCLLPIVLREASLDLWVSVQKTWKLMSFAKLTGFFQTANGTTTSIIVARTMCSVTSVIN